MRISITISASDISMESVVDLLRKGKIRDGTIKFEHHANKELKQYIVEGEVDNEVFAQAFGLTVKAK